MQIELVLLISLIGLIALTGLIAGYFSRENKVVVRHAWSTLSPAASESGRRYKEIFDNGSDGVFE